MTGLQAWLTSLGHDTKLVGVLVMLAIDLVLGVMAAVKLGTFRFAYIGDVLRTDVLGKVVPWAVLYLLVKATNNVELGWGIDLSTAENIAYGLVIVALAGSVLGSLKDLGIGTGLPPALTGKEKADPPPKEEPAPKPA